MRKILVTGAGGQLGKEISEIANCVDTPFCFTTHLELDITNQTRVAQFFSEHSFDVVVNCAAYTAVDKAETESNLCYLINEQGAKNLAEAAETFGFFLIHISTDFVFDGNTTGLLTEEDLVRPLSVYGASKLAGEHAIMATTKRFVIIRTSWLYSSYGVNFVKTILRLANEKPTLNIIADQIGTPTYAADLAQVILIIAQSQDLINHSGIYHYSNEGVASWYDFAIAICDLAGLTTPILPIETTQYPTPAERPKYSVMHKGKIKSVFSISIPHWRASLKKCIYKLNQ